MALFNPLDDEITCREWPEVYIDPQVTSSPPYTFCLQCIQLLNQGTTDQCPQCKHKTQQQIKHSITDLLQKHNDLIKVSTELCGLCKTTRRPIKYRCEDCDDFMCEQCEKTHSGMKLCRSHTVKSISHLTQTFQQSLQPTLSQLQADFTLTDQQSQTVTHNIKLVNSSRRTQIKHVHTSIRDIISNVKEYEQYLIGQIQKENTNILESLWDERNSFNDSKQKIQHNIDCVNEMINSEDFITLKQNTINNTMRENMVEIKSMLPEVSQMTLSPVTVQTNSQWDVKESIHIHVNQRFTVYERKSTQEMGHTTEQSSQESWLSPEVQTNDQHRSAETVFLESEAETASVVWPKFKPESNLYTVSVSVDQEKQVLREQRNSDNQLIPETSYADICKNEYKFQAKETTAYSCYKLCEVNGEIWHAGQDEITVFDEQCQEIRNVHHDTISWITGLTFSETHNQVIVSCYDTGLHQLGTDGQYVGQILTGMCTDVCTHEDCLYALSFNNKIIVFTYSGDQWERVNEIQVKYINSNSSDRLKVNSTGIYVGSWHNKCVYKYTLEGEFLEEIRYRQSVLHKMLKQAGYLVLCDVDEEGNVLVADYNNCKLYVIFNNTWQAIKLTGIRLNGPFHCLIDRYDNMWVGTCNNDIIKYKLFQR